VVPINLLHHLKKMELQVDLVVEQNLLQQALEILHQPVHLKVFLVEVIPPVVLKLVVVVALVLLAVLVAAVILVLVVLVSRLLLLDQQQTPRVLVI
jgi:hypothetical protein|tara:strand:+ start:147 stop:434 length:288 start_codon:yes stop_codon:yes gene_type:complete